MTVTNKTYSAKANEVERKWYLIDAEGEILGRLATRVANILRGKNKPQYTPNVDTGDFVVVINADKVKVSGKKETDKIYYHHTGYPGGLKSASFNELMAKDPRLAIEKAVKGMLQHNTLGDTQFTKLKVYAGTEHPHEAQKPITLPKEARQ
jgi:large subunit ribosomal protein L13